ncbi:MAG: NAD(P)H-quinone oxidoreductase [Roseiarcus sp.]|jgi:NADPH2:quinone reductase
MARLPDEMRAVAIAAPGGPEALTSTKRPRPDPGAREILVRVAAAGVNRPDVLQRQGLYTPPPGASDLPGLEFAGEVVALGKGASRFKLGDPVTALVAGGGYAEYCVVAETNALPVPDGMSLIEAAAIPETYCTVWTNVFDRGGLQRGEWLLVHGGTSGIGTTAIQLAKAFEAHVLTTVGSTAKAKACVRLGADLAIVYKDEDFVVATLAATGGKGADVILDMVGGDYVARNYAAAAVDGRIVQIAFLHGRKVEVDLQTIMAKRLVHTGSTLRPRSVAEKAEIIDSLQTRVWPLLAEGRCRPLIDSTFPLAEAAAAHRRIENADHVGKIVLTL